MAGFNFSVGIPEIEIEGKKYPVSLGHPVIQQKILKFSLHLMGTSLTDLDDEMLPWVSDQIHGFVAELLGEEAKTEIFAGREPNLMDELRLFVYIQQQISNDRRLVELENALGRYSARETL